MTVKSREASAGARIVPAVDRLSPPARGSVATIVITFP